MAETLESLVAGARDALGNPGTLFGDGGNQPPFELFNAANSICSQKVRSVLLHHGLPFLNHDINMFTGQTYLPGYVRLRMRGCERFGGALVSRHTGSTSAQAGCDGVVVPTLVDWRTGEVLVDSKRICLFLDTQVSEERRLRPDHLSGEIDAELAIVDELPNYQLLMGRSTGSSEAIETRENKGGRFSERKVALCDHYLRECADDPQLVRAYIAKRAKELSAVNALFSADAMRAAYSRAEAALGDLERKLERSAGCWLLGDRLTMADLFWGIELLRMQNVGVSAYWEDGRLPHVARLLENAGRLQAIRTAIIEWPGAMY